MLRTCPCLLAAEGLAAAVGGGVSPPEHFRSTSISHMSVLSSGGTRYVVKAVPDYFGHEGAVVAVLSAAAPGTVPAPVALGANWWIAREFVPQGEPTARSVLDTLLAVQRAVGPRLDELRLLGVRRITGLGILRVIEQHLDELHGSQDGLLQRWETLATSLARMDDPRCPVALVHGDLNPENVVLVAGGTLVYDWTDVSITHPFVDLVRLHGLADFAIAARRYVTAWSSGHDSVGQAVREADVWGAAFQLWNYLGLVARVRAYGADLMDLGELRDHWARALVSSLDRLNGRPSTPNRSWWA